MEIFLTKRNFLQDIPIAVGSNSITRSPFKTTISGLMIGHINFANNRSSCCAPIFVSMLIMHVTKIVETQGSKASNKLISPADISTSDSSITFFFSFFAFEILRNYFFFFSFHYMYIYMYTYIFNNTFLQFFLFFRLHLLIFLMKLLHVHLQSKTFLEDHFLR